MLGFSFNKIRTTIFLLMFSCVSYSETILQSVEKRQYSGKSIGFSYCSHKTTNPESLIKLIKKFGHINSETLGHLEIARIKNKHISDFNKIKKGEYVFIPLFYLKNKFKNLKYHLPCSIVFGWHNSRPFLLKGKKYQDLSRSVSNVKNKKYSSEINIQAGGIYDSLHQSTGAILTSDLQPYLGLFWRQKINNQWGLLAGVNYISKKYNKAVNSNIKINNKNLTQSSFFLGIEYFWGRLTSLRFTAEQSDATYFSKTQTNVYTVQKNKSILTKLDFSKKIFRYKNIFFAMNGIMSLAPFIEDEFESKTNYGLGLIFESYINPKISFGINSLYKRENIKFKNNKTEHRWLEVILNYRIKF